MGTGGSKKKTEEGNKDRWSVAERKHPYEDCVPDPNLDEEKPDITYEVKKPVRPYEDVPGEFGNKDEEEQNNTARLSQKGTGGELNYIDVEFTKPKKEKKKKNKEKLTKKDNQKTHQHIEPTVEYSEVIVENSHPVLKS